jgi:hypothetical protein
VRRHAILAARTQRPYPAYYDDVRNRRFEVPRPVLPVAPVSRPHMATPTTFLPLQHPPVTIRFTQTKNIEALQKTLDEVKKILLIQQQRDRTPMVRPIPIQAPAPSTQGPPPPSSSPPSRLQQHFSSTPEPAAYSVPNPFCTECNSFHSPLNVNDYGPTDQEMLDSARRESMEDLRVQADAFASDLLLSANDRPVRRRRVTPAARRTSPYSSPPSASHPARSPSLHRSLEPSPEPRTLPVQHETPGSSLNAPSPASPTPSFTNRMGQLTVQLTDNRRVVYRRDEEKQ